MKNNKKYIAYDALFCVIIIICSVVMGGLATFSKGVAGVLLAVLVGIYFRRKKLLRCVTACVVILLLLFMMQGPVLCISLYIWNLIAGIVLKYILELKMISFYIAAIPTFWMLFLVESYFYSKLLLNMTTTEYLLKMAEKMQEHATFLNSEMLVAILYFGCVSVGMAVLKSITARKIYQVYAKKFEAFDKQLP